MTGTLYLCATPIGNLEDMTLRGLRILKEVDLIAAEDTRNSIRLLNYFDIKTKMTSYHEHNQAEKGPMLVERLKAGQNVALITDAGTPGISDPGEDLVRRCLEEDIPVTALPGACACITALTLSGLSTGRFAFEAFLPAEKKEREKIWSELNEETRTILLYEAPHHLRKTLEECRDHLGNRRAALLRELTKLHEDSLRGTLDEMIDFYQVEEPRGEYVLVIEGKSRREIIEEEKASWEQVPLKAHMKLYLDRGMEKKEAMRRVAQDRGIAKREVYNALLRDDDA